MRKKTRYYVGDDPDFKVGCVVAYWRRDPGSPKPQFVQAAVEEIDGDMAFVQRLDNFEERYMPIARFVQITEKAPQWYREWPYQDPNPDDDIPF